MRTLINNLNVLVFLTLLFVAAVANAAPDAGAKMRGQVNNFYGPQRTQSYARGSYVAPAPMVTPAPALAQAETPRRSFSAEPQAPVNGQWVQDRCGNWRRIAATPAPATGSAAEETRRTYSYEPATAAPVRTRGTRVPLYVLPKTDARKFGP